MAEKNIFMQEMAPGYASTFGCIYVYKQTETHFHSYHVALGHGGERAYLSDLEKQITMAYFICKKIHLHFYVFPPSPFVE